MKLPEGRISVVIVDDHELVAKGLAALLGDVADIAVAGVYDRAAAAECAVADLHPRVALVDFRLPDANGAELTRRIRSASPDTQVVIVTAARDEQVLNDALDAGCSGFVTKGSGVGDLVEAVRRAADGGTYFTADVMALLVRRHRAAPPGPVTDLTARELEILQYLADGRTTKDLARDLHLSLHTVRNHVRNILGKLGARSRLEAVVIAAREQLVTFEGADGG